MEKLTSRVIGFIVLLAFCVVMSVTSNAWAWETEEHGRYVGEKAELKVARVGDVDEHVAGSYHGTGVFFGLGDEEQEILTSFTGETFDIVNKGGAVMGFTVDVFKDGPTVTVRSEDVAKLDENKEQYFEGTYQCISGTGRWKGIA